MDTNAFGFRSVYPTGQGGTVATGATGSQTSMRTPTGGVAHTDEMDPVDRAREIGNQASPVVAALVLLGLVVGLMYGAKWLGTDEDFRSIRPTVYNGLTIAAAATIFMPVIKWAFVRFPIPGATAWVLAA